MAAQVAAAGEDGAAVAPKAGTEAAASTVAAIAAAPTVAAIAAAPTVVAAAAAVATDRPIDAASVVVAAAHLFFLSLSPDTPTILHLSHHLREVSAWLESDAAAAKFHVFVY
jgi:hypothetical protein